MQQFSFSGSGGGSGSGGSGTGSVTTDSGSGSGTGSVTVDGSGSGSGSGTGSVSVDGSGSGSGSGGSFNLDVSGSKGCGFPPMLVIFCSASQSICTYCYNFQTHIFSVVELCALATTLMDARVLQESCHDVMLTSWRPLNNSCMLPACTVCWRHALHK